MRWRLIHSMGLLALLLTVPTPLRAQTQPIGAIAALIGEGAITHAMDTQRVSAKVSDDVYARDRIETGERSVIRVLMGGRITVTIRERSIVTITDDPMRSRVDLQGGKLALKVHDGGLRPGEVAELLTPNAVTGIRGSLVVAAVSGADSDVTVLEAHKPITIAPRNNPTQTTHLPIGHTIRVSGPLHAPRMGQIRRAPRSYLTHAADLAEVPGRPRDGGQERMFQRLSAADARQHAAAATRQHAMDGHQRTAADAHPRAAADRQRQVSALPRRAARDERDEAADSRPERPGLARRFGAH
jgi:FecR protein